MRKITIIGTGYVGLVSGAGIAEFGHDVTCVDIDQEKIDQLKKGVIPIYEPGLKSLVTQNIQKEKLSFSHDVTASIEAAQILFIAVGTPQGKNGEADLSAVEAVAETIAGHLNDYKIVCMKSTVPIGTGEKIEKIILSKNSKRDFDYVSNPEFLREGAAVNDFLHPDRIIIGTRSDAALEIMRDVYRPLYINETPMVATTVETAEMIKYASNAFLALKISYINEVANLCDAVGADVHVVSKAMGKDGRISPKFLHPGPGYGGSCFPKDTEALVFTGRQNNAPMRTIEAAMQTNREQKLKMVEKMINLLDGEIAGKTIAVLGLAFKPQTDDVREAASRVIIPALIDKGATIHAHDPIAMENFKRHHPEISYFEDWQSTVDKVDALIILTEWNEFRGIDLSDLKSRMKTPNLLDTKNIFSINQLSSLEFNFDNIGRNIL